MKIQAVNTKQLSTGNLNHTYKVAANLFNRFAAQNPDTDNLVNDFFESLANSKSLATQKTYKAAIKKAMKQTLKVGGLDTSAALAQLDSAFKEIKSGTIKTKVGEEEILTPAELEKLLSISGEKTKLIIKALYQTAGRVSELVNIKLSDCFKTPQGMIIKVIGKGKKERTFFMTVDLFEAIKATYKGNTYLFENSKGEAISRFTVQGLIKKAGRQIGRGDIHAHTIRHSFATNRLDELGIDAVSDYLGHSSPETTAKYYLHNKPTITAILQQQI